MFRRKFSTGAKIYMSENLNFKSMTWGSIAQKFKVSADDVASIINNIEVKSHETLKTHKDDVPSNSV